MTDNPDRTIRPDQTAYPERTEAVDPIVAPDRADHLNDIDLDGDPVIAEHPELADTIFADNDEDLETSFASTSTALSTEMGEEAREDAAADPETVELMEKMVPGSSAELAGEQVTPEEIRRDPIIEDRQADDHGLL